MAGFRKDKTGVAQTAANSASTYIAALATAGLLTDAKVAAKEFKTHYENVFAELALVVEADNEMFAALDATEAARPAKSGGGRSYPPRNSGGGGGGGTVSIEDALATTFNFGAFKDLTIGEVLDLDEDGTSDYGYQKSGRSYIAWVSKNKDNPFMAKRAKVVLDSARSGSDS